LFLNVLVAWCEFAVDFLLKIGADYLCVLVSFIAFAAAKCTSGDWCTRQGGAIEGVDEA
jgi:hypothetical protein